MPERSKMGEMDASPTESLKNHKAQIILKEQALVIAINMPLGMPPSHPGVSGLKSWLHSS